MEKLTAPDQVATVLVNWNGFHDTVAALESLRRATPAPGVVVVVDNGSTDGSAEKLSRWAEQQGVACTSVLACDLSRNHATGVGRWPQGLAIASSPRNLGFAGGVNLGIRTACALSDPSYVLLLNNDATVAPDFLPPLLAELEDPKVAAATGVIYRADRPRELWYAGGTLDRLRALGAHRTGSLPSSPCDVEFITGCFALLRLRALEQLGLLPEVYFLYTEDLELSCRLRAAGYRLRFTPHAVAYHKVGAAAGDWRDSPLIAYLHNRNRLWFVRRNLPPVQRAVSLAWLVPTRLSRAAGQILSGRPKIAWQVLRGTMDGLFAPVERPREASSGPSTAR